jgi:tRNA(Arg) A34 adenosine deaminase TadA
VNDQHFMRDALNEARIAFDKGEIPIGAVLVRDGQIIARGHNLARKRQTRQPMLKCGYAGSR